MRAILNYLKGLRGTTPAAEPTPPPEPASQTLPGPMFVGRIDVADADALAIAARQIGWCASREAQVVAEHKECLALLEQDLAEHLIVTGYAPDGEPEPVHLRKYRVDLEAAVCDFARNHPEVFPPKKKTLTLVGATLKTAAAPLKVDAEDREALLADLSARLDLPALLQSLAGQYADLPLLLKVLRVHVSLDLAGALVRLKAGDVTRAELEGLGFVVTEGAEQVSVKAA